MIAARRADSVSIVIPVFEERESLDALRARLSPVLDRIERTRAVDVVVVDDGSRDGSLDRLIAWQASDPRVSVVEFNRNYGQHAAVFAGFEHSTGEIVVTLDADLQNPPEEIETLLAKIDEGFDVVGTRRIRRKDRWLRRRASELVNVTTRRLIGVDAGDFGCMLRAYRREVVGAMCASKELSTFIPALAELYASRSIVVEVRHEARAAGRSKYSLAKLVRLHLDLFTSFSAAPLRLLLVLGAAIGGLGFLLALAILTKRALSSNAEWEQWGQGGLFTNFAVVYMFIGAQFVAFGILGEYIGRIYGEVRRRPRFVVRRVRPAAALSGEEAGRDAAGAERRSNGSERR